MSIANWDMRFMALAKEARSWTKGLGAGVDRGVGACVVSPDKRQLSLGYAGFPRGLKDSTTRLSSKGFRSFHTVHAELNALLNARTSLEGWTLYSTECPCSDCASAIIQAGITRVVSPPPRKDSPNWYQSQLEGADAMRECRIAITRTGNIT